MSSKHTYRGDKDKCDPGLFVKLPHNVLNSGAYTSLSARGRMLLIDIAMQFRGNNNGDLCAAWKFMKPRGWQSEATLNAAKKELLASGLVCETRMGARPNKATLYAVTWRDLDHCNGKLEMKPANFPRGAYKATIKVDLTPTRFPKSREVREIHGDNLKKLLQREQVGA
jgi:hypothetical protein